MKTCVYSLGLVALVLCCSTGRSKAEECGFRSMTNLMELVAGGKEVKRGEFPWHVALYKRKGERDEWIQHCGGTLISRDLVLTAALCVVVKPSIIDKTNLRVGLGKIWRGKNQSEPFSVIASVKEVVVPANYFGFDTNYAKDIALLRLSLRLKYNDYIRPACVDWDQTLHLQVNEIISVAGWGETSLITRKRSEQLLAAKLEYLNHRTCVQRIINGNINQEEDQQKEINEVSITHDKICAQMVNDSQALKGDNGGGMIVKRNEKYYVVGILSAVLTKQYQHSLPTTTMFTNIADITHMTWLKNERTRLISEECGTRSSNIEPPSIRQGTEAYSGEFPWHVALYKREGETDEWKQYCGGTLISRDLVLTAAQCIYDMKMVKFNTADIEVGLGKINADMDYAEDSSVIASVKGMVVPSGYGGEMLDYAHDIAVLQLSESVQYNDVIRPACVDWDQTVHLTVGESVLLTGWKKEGKVLHTANFTYYDHETCVVDMMMSSGFTELQLPNDKICARMVKGSQVGMGYSGGGAIVERNGRHFIVGILNGRFTSGDVAAVSNIGDDMNWLRRESFRLLD